MHRRQNKKAHRFRRALFKFDFELRESPPQLVMAMMAVGVHQI
jgi:hypothetical protein